MMLLNYTKKGFAFITAGLFMIFLFLPAFAKVTATPKEKAVSGKTSGDTDTNPEKSGKRNQTSGHNASGEPDGTMEKDTTSEPDLIASPDVTGSPESTFDPVGTYHASLGIQTASNLRIERFGYYTEGFGDIYCPYGEENWLHLTRKYDPQTDDQASDLSNSTAATESAEEPAVSENPDEASIAPGQTKKPDNPSGQTEETEENPESENRIVVPGDFTDAELKGNGTYTLMLEHADFQGETCISQLHIATDFPYSDQISFTDITVMINDTEIVHFDEAIIQEGSAETNGGMVLLLLHTEDEMLKERLEELQLPQDSANGWELLSGEEDETISVTFTVSGFDYDNEDAVPTDEPSAIEKIVIDDPSNNPIKDAKSDRPSIGAIVGIILVVLAAGISVIVIRKRK